MSKTTQSKTEAEDLSSSFISPILYPVKGVLILLVA